jgi:hypothetical protein
MVVMWPDTETSQDVVHATKVVGSQVSFVMCQEEERRQRHHREWAWDIDLTPIGEGESVGRNDVVLLVLQCPGS